MAKADKGLPNRSSKPRRYHTQTNQFTSTRYNSRIHTRISGRRCQMKAPTSNLRSAAGSDSRGKICFKRVHAVGRIVNIEGLA